MKSDFLGAEFVFLGVCVFVLFFYLFFFGGGDFFFILTNVYACSPCYSSSRFGVSLPSVVLTKRNDPLQSSVVFQGDFTEETIVNFVKYSSLPLYVSCQAN